MSTKQAVIDKYNKKNAPKNKTATQNTSGTGNNFQKQEGNFQLGDKIDKETLGIKLLREGYMQAYIDFFYLTNDTTPSYIQPSPELEQEY